MKGTKIEFSMNYFPNLSKLKLTCSLIFVLMTLPFLSNAQEGEDELPDSFYGNWVEDMAQCEVASILSIAGSDEGLIVSSLDWYSSDVEVQNKGDFYTLLIKGSSEEGDFETEINVKMGEEGSLIYFYTGLEENKLVKCEPNGEVDFVEVEVMEDLELEVEEVDMVGTIDLEAAVLDLPSDFYGYWVEDLAQCEVAPILSIVDSEEGLTVSSLDWSSNVVEVQNKGDFYTLLIKGSSEEGDFETEINVKMGEEGNLIYSFPGLEETNLVKCDLGDNVMFVEVEMEEMEELELVEAELEVEEFDMVDTVSMENINIELLQGKWQSVEDESSYLIFEGDRMQIYTVGMEDEMEDEAFMISDTCMNESDGSNDLPQEENRYLSNPNLDMCWYIEVLDANNLSLIYLSRGNQLTYKRVE
jgi:hypothetical protein